MAKRVKAAGFTLVELLVVVAVIAALVAILLPSLSRARKRARLVQCLANTRGLSQTLQMYVGDWGSGITFHGTGLFSWPYIFIAKPPSFQKSATYGGGPEDTQTTVGSAQGNYGVSPKMFLCPETLVGPNLMIGSSTRAWGHAGPEIGEDPNLHALADQWLSGSYGLNAFLYNNFSSSDTAEWPGISLREAVATIGVSPDRAFRLPSPGNDADIPAFSDCDWYHVAPSPSDTPLGSLTDPGPPYSPVNSEEYTWVEGFNPMARVVMGRHDRAINVSFVDGHAVTVPLKELWTLKWSTDWKPRPASSIALPPR